MPWFIILRKILYLFKTLVFFLRSPDNMDSCALGKFVTAKTEEQDDIVFGNTIGSDPNPRVLDIQSWPVCLFISSYILHNFF